MNHCTNANASTIWPLVQSAGVVWLASHNPSAVNTMLLATKASPATLVGLRPYSSDGCGGWSRTFRAYEMCGGAPSDMVGQRVDVALCRVTERNYHGVTETLRRTEKSWSKLMHKKLHEQSKRHNHLIFLHFSEIP